MERNYAMMISTTEENVIKKYQAKTSPNGRKMAAMKRDNEWRHRWKLMRIKEMAK